MPEATAKTDTIPAPRDVPYPGTIQLTVDASDVTRAIFRVHQHVPVPAAGDFVLLYPKWMPGHHSPSGQINKIGRAAELLIKSGDLYRTAGLDWHGGLQYPRLEKAGKG